MLHWTIAALIAANLLLAWSFSSFAMPTRHILIDTHTSIGLTVLGLAILRLLWRATHTPPPIPPYAAWERRAARFAHWTLYGLIFLLPITGGMQDSAWKSAAAHKMKLFFVIPWFRIGAIEQLDPVAKEHFHSLLFAIHVALAYVLCAMLVVHVAGALKHQWLDREPELQRMWPAQRRTKTQ
jgi:cytochrome b561